MSLTSRMIRKMFKSGDDKRDEGLTTPHGILRKNDILYGTDPDWQKMDIYYPKDAKEECYPVIVSVHGGGWVYGDKERYQFYCMDLALRGFAVVNYTYRLAPESKYPAQIEDTNLVFEWIVNHAEEYRLDKDHIFAVGDSAGGHMLALYCCMMNDAEMRKDYSFTIPRELKIQAVGLNCGVYEIKKEDKGLVKSLMKDLLEHKGSKEELNAISPMKHINASFPPAFIMTASGDFLREQAAPMAEALKELGVEVIYRCYGDESNKLPHVFHCNIKSEDARICNDDEAAFFKGKL